MKKCHALGLLMSVVLLAGCSPAPVVTAEPSQAAATPTAATPSAASQTPSPKASLAAPLPSKGVVTTAHGSYLQTSIAENDPALTLNPALVDRALASMFSTDDIKAANQFLVRFFAEEGLDSSLNGEDDVDGWVAAHRSQLHPAAPADLIGCLSDKGGGFLMRVQYLGASAKPVYGADQTRIVSRSITPTRVWGWYDPRVGQGQNVLRLDAKYTVVERIVKDGEPGQTMISGTAGYVAAKDTDGSWKLVGARIQWQDMGAPGSTPSN